MHPRLLRSKRQSAPGAADLQYGYFLRIDPKMAQRSPGQKSVREPKRLMAKRLPFACFIDLKSGWE